MSPRILFLHGLCGSPQGAKVATLRRCFGESQVCSPQLPFSRESLGLAGWGPAADQPGGLALDLVRSGTLLSLLEEAIRLARGAVKESEPEVIVGSSLGGGIAMKLAVEFGLGQVLLAPVWNPRLALFSAMPGATDWLARLAIPQSIPARTVVLHSARDEVVSIEQSRDLLRRSPLSREHPEAGKMRRVMEALGAQGFAVEDRLVVTGEDHQVNDGPSHLAMTEAVRLLSVPESDPG